MSNNLRWNQRIRYERQKRGWSQAMAARYMNIDVRSLRHWEAGLHAPNYESRLLLSQIYGQSIEELGLLDPKPVR